MISALCRLAIIFIWLFPIEKVKFWQNPRSMAALPTLRCRISHMWVKLSNSGEALKLLVLSHRWKSMSGWTNYSGTVTSQEILERKMGYRGSKSAIGLYRPTSQIRPGAVKEQRVDGSYANNIALRCILMGFERSYQIKVLSKQKKYFILIIILVCKVLYHQVYICKINF